MSEEEKDIVLQYLNTMQSDASKMSHYILIKQARRIFKIKNSNFNWSELRADHLNILINDLKRRERAPNTINAYLSAMKGLSKQLWVNKLITVEDYQHIKEVKRARGSKVDSGRSLSGDELRVLTHACQNVDLYGKRDKALITTIFGAGLRRQEASNLKATDYNKIDKNLTITGKGNRQRKIHLSKMVYQILDSWLLNIKFKNGPMFPRIIKTKNGQEATSKYLSGRSIYDIVQKRWQQADIEKLTPHDLRRTFASTLLENKTDIFIVQRLMGHSSVATTQRYDKRSDSELIAASTKLEF